MTISKRKIFFVAFGLMLVGMYGFANKFSEPVVTALAAGIFAAVMSAGRGQKAC